MQKKRVIGLQNLHKLENAMWKWCQLEMMTKSSLLRKQHSTSDSLELVHIDLGRPMRVERYYGDRYFILLLGLF